MIIYILSSSKNGIPLSTGVIPPNDLENWNKAFDPALGYMPAPASVLGAGNVNQGEFLHVKAVDVRPLFCRVNLREFPYPQTATTQTANAGGGYTPNNTYTANIGAFSFSFIAPAADFNNVGPPLAGTAAGSITLSGTRSQITRNGATTTTMGGTIPAPGGAGGAAANFDITINDPPWWGMTPPGVGAGNQMPNNANTQTFYVIKGTSLSLYASGAALPANPILTVQVNADSTFEYFNGSWTRVD
jgi:hypothetical protein